MIPATDQTKTDFRYWLDFMEKNVDFNLKESVKHNLDHCARVLLYSLMIADKMDLSEDDKALLAAAAVFHDSRRIDDWYDTGHGQRAAEYYKQYCLQNSLVLTFSPVCHKIIFYHDLHDANGLEALSQEKTANEKALLLYQIFKDADALDRLRLGKEALDISYLRTPASADFYELAYSLRKFSAQELLAELGK